MHTEQRSVTIIGAGVAGLTLGNLLLRSGVDCVILEARDRAYIEQRQRAGVLEHHAALVYEEGGLGGVIADAPDNGVVEIRVDGTVRLFDQLPHTGGRSGRQLAQQLLVRRLIAAYLDGGGDLRFEAGSVALHDLDGARPSVTYQGPDGEPRRVESSYVAGCDGFHGASRASVPEGALTSYANNGETPWFTVLATAPPPARPLFAVSRHGFAAQFARGPQASRFYLQCAPGDDLATWSDERIWEQLRRRMADEQLPDGPITEKALVDQRGYVVEPMAYGRLFLVGDAAHIIPVMGGKGMNLAIADAGELARGLRAALVDGDEGPLRGYSETCLRRVWSYQDMVRWMAEMLFEAGAPDTAGPFRHRMARARLDRLFTIPSQAKAFSEFLAGVW